MIIIKNRLNILVLATTLLSLVVIGCGEKDDDKEDDDTGNSGFVSGSSNPDASKATQTIDASSPSSIVGVAASTLASAAVGGDASTLRLSQDSDDSGDSQSDSVQSENDPLCSEHGEPWDENTNAVMLGDNEEETSRHFYCLLNSKVIESSDTIPGLLRMQQSVICAMEAGVGLTEASFTEEGTNLITGASQTIPLTAACFPQGLPDGMTEVTAESVTATKLAESTGWQYQLRIVSAAAELDYTLRYFNKDGIFGFANMGPGANGGSGESYQIVVDTVSGVLLFNSIQDRGGAGGADSSYRGLHRLRVKGTLDADLKFTAIDEGRAFTYTSGPGFSTDSGSRHTYSMYTVDGSEDDGFKFSHFTNNQDSSAVPVEGTVTCSDGECANSKAVGTPAEMDALAFRAADVKTAWEAFKTAKPLCDPATGGSDNLTMSAVPAHVGSFGVCE